MGNEGERLTSITAILSRYRQPSLLRSLTEAGVSFGGLFVLCAAIYLLRDHGWPLLVLTPLASFFVVRVFIIQHDCGHLAFFRSRALNHAMGVLCSLFTFTPYFLWRRQHAAHHRVWNNLDRRETGLDIYSSCLTVKEYSGLSRGRRLLFRIAHSVIISQLLLPPLVFLVLYRFPFDAPAQWRRERLSVHATNAGLAMLIGGMAVIVGWRSVALVYGPVIVLAAVIGVWLFSVQHRFPGAQWYRSAEWSFRRASLEGSSCLRLPALLHWLTGNIGFHHVHHLSPSMPNYRLAACHRAMLEASFIPQPALAFGTALRSSGYVLWDEDRAQMVRPLP
jgi:omega-6 fatty acid desaturase (delta-12 desaturase)